MLQKKMTYGLTGLLLGIALGAVLGIGELKWIKTSQRSQVLPFAIGISVLICGSVGFSLGSKMGKEKYIDERLGIDNKEEKFYKDGRFWIGITKWTDKRNSEQHQLITKRDSSGTLVTLFNNQLLFTHQIPNANQQTVPKYHQLSRNQLWKELKEKFTETI